MDDPSINRNAINICCLMGSHKVNHLMYADDIVLTSPPVMGMKKLYLKSAKFMGMTSFNSSKSTVQCTSM